MDQQKLNRVMAGGGLLFFGGASIAANVLSVTLPPLEGDWTTQNVEAWQALPKKTDVDGWAYFWAVLFPVAALMGIEFVSRFTGLHKVLRYGVLGLASAVAIVSSYLHIVHVLLWYGQGVLISTVGPIAVDGLMILCTLQLLSTVRVTGVLEDMGQDKAEDTHPVPAPVDIWRVPAPSLSAVPLGPVPPPVVPRPRVSHVPPVDTEDKARTEPPRDKAPREVKTRGNWDRAEAAKLIMTTDLSNEEIGQKVGTSYKTIQRLRREIRENPAMVEGMV